jgi:hypothetical protein
VKSFQEGAGLLVDGIVGPLTWNALPDGGPMPVLREGSSGALVQSLQRVLTNGAPGEWGTTPQGIDGIFGPHTKASVEAFQAWGGVAVDGVVGDQTWSVSLHAASATLETAVGLNFVIDWAFVAGSLSVIGASLSPIGGRGLTPYWWPGRGLRSAESASAAAPISEATNRDPSARLPPVIDRTLPFAEAKEAYRISKVAADFRQGRDHTRLIVRVQPGLMKYLHVTNSGRRSSGGWTGCRNEPASSSRLNFACRPERRHEGNADGVVETSPRLLCPGSSVCKTHVTRLGQPDGISRSRMAEMLEVDKAGPIVRC